MLTCGRFFGLAALLVAVGVYFLGLVDRPPFVATTSPDLVAIVALSDDKDYGGNIMRLLQGTIKGIRAATPPQKDGDANHSHKRALMGAASRYGSPMGAEYLSVGLYLDDPRTVANPRWAIGYALDVSYDQAHAMAAEIGKIDGTNVVRAVRISLASTLSARVPWRNLFTPMIGPRLHWPRGMDLYRTEGHSTKCGRHRNDDGGCAIAMEAYVTGPKGSKEWIDYTIVMGDTTQTYDDLYPEPATETDHQQEMQQPVPPEVPDSEPKPERETQETVGDAGAAEPEIEPQQEAQEVVEEADAAPEIEAQQDVHTEDVEAAAAAHSEGTGSEVRSEHHEPEVAAGDHQATDADHSETHSQPEIVPEDPEPEAPPHEDSHTLHQEEETVENHHDREGEAESDGDAMGDAEFEGEEDSEHDAEENEEDFGDEQEEGAENEPDVNDEDEQEDEEVADEEEGEEYFDEEDAGGEYSDQDDEDEVEHFEDEEGHDEF